MWTLGFDDRVYSTTYATSLLHFKSHAKSLLLSVFSVLSSHADWTWLGSLRLTAHAECWLLNCWLLTALVWTRLLVAYSLLLWSLHVSGLTANCSLTPDCWNLPPLSRSSGLDREHLVQGFSLSSTQRWLAYSVAGGIQQFCLCCVGSSLGRVCLCVRCHWNTRSYCGRCVAIDVI
jgi:hypothetical protein